MARTQQRADLAVQLADPAAYAHEGFAPARVDVVETHVSYLFMTGELVYKVKKAVDLGFVDFTTLESRSLNTQRELELNRRISLSVYLGVVPVMEHAGRLAFGGPGTVVDHALKMRQLPRERMLDAMLTTDAVSVSDIERVGRRIAAFHATVETSAEITRIGGRRAMTRLVAENFAQTASHVGPLLGREMYEEIEAYMDGFLQSRRPLFERREAAGHVRDGHGDLHAAQICLVDEIEFIDCIEFSAEYRYGDTASDLAFLAMDLDRYGRADLSAALVRAYVEESGDAEAAEVLDFYRCYRAYVRAKVTGMRLATASLTPEERASATETASAYYRLAHAYARAALPERALYVVMGLPGTGKSTLAAAIAGRWGLPLVPSDVVRKRLAGIDPGEHRHAPYEAGLYTAGRDQATYAAMLLQAEQHLTRGSAVVDGSFRTTGFRSMARQAARRAGAQLWLVECTAPEAVVHGRIRLREERGTGASDATEDVYERRRADWEPVMPAEGGHRAVLDTSQAPSDVLVALVRHVYRFALAGEPGR
jgi:aminoglycoside phosphotransferase family enzyme/predicted kinase